MKQRKKGMQDIEVTKKEGANELSNNVLKNTSGGNISKYEYRDGTTYEVRCNDGAEWETFSGFGEASEYDKLHGGSGRVTFLDSDWD